MSGSYTGSGSDTYSDARAKKVMGKVYDDFLAMEGRQFGNLSRQGLRNIKEDLLFFMKKKALRSFQMQFIHGSEEWAVEFVVSSDGTLHVDSESAEEDYWDIPKEAKVGLVADIDKTKKSVRDYLVERKWGNDGQFFEGERTSKGGYSDGGFGVSKNTIGSWEKKHQ